MTNEERDMEILAARQVYRPDYMQRLFAQMEKAIMSAWAMSTSTEEREHLHYKFAALGDLLTALRTIGEQPTTEEAVKYESR